MNKKHTFFDFASEEQKQAHLNAIIGFFHDERDEEIGILAAQEILDFFLQTVGSEVYKKAVYDCTKLVQERFEDMNVELNGLSPS